MVVLLVSKFIHYLSGMFCLKKFQTWPESNYCGTSGTTAHTMLVIYDKLYELDSKVYDDNWKGIIVSVMDTMSPT